MATRIIERSIVIQLSKIFDGGVLIGDRNMMKSVKLSTPYVDYEFPLTKFLEVPRSLNFVMYTTIF